MDRLVSMAVFRKVAESGSFAAAARALNLSAPMATKHVARLEDWLGVRLLNRTTRRVTVTEAGTDFLGHCIEILDRLDEAEASASKTQSKPRGRLRINAPMSFGIRYLGEPIAQFLSLNPDVSVELTLNDRMVDMVEEGYDLLIRIGRLSNSSYVARRLARSRLVVCAHPDYLARRGTPQIPEDLNEHECLVYSLSSSGDIWGFTKGNQRRSIQVVPRLRANNGDVLGDAAMAGLGILRGPEFMHAEDILAGRLVEVLPDWRPEEASIHALYASSRGLPAKVRAFIDFLVEYFAQNPRWAELPN